MNGQPTRPTREEMACAIEEALPVAFALAWRVAGRREEAEDAVADVAASLLARAGRLELEAPAGIYFRQAVARRALKIARARSARARREEEVAMNAARERSAQPGSAEAAESAELARAVHEALGRLDADERLPIALVYLGGLGQSEAAKELGVPLTTLASRIERGLSRMRAVLSAAGFAAVSMAALAGAFDPAGGCPPPPAALTAKIQSLLAGQAGTASPAAVAAKGGIAMKVFLGVVVAGTLAGGAALFFGPPTAHRLSPAGLASPPVSGPPKVEHWAFVTHADYLDGLRREAMCPAPRGGPVDERGNMYVLSYGAIRVVREDGKVETVAGDDRWVNDLGLDDGPACCLPAVARGGGANGIATSWLTVSGLPLDGEDKGCLYAGVKDGKPYRLFKNKEKGGRWWMRRVGTGKTPLPTEVGKTAAVKDLDLTGAEIRNGYLTWKGNCYRFDEGKGEVACVLSYADYQDKVVHPNVKYQKPPKEKTLGLPEQLVRAEDGSFYLQYYYQCYSEGVIFKIPPDRSKVELIAWSTGGQNVDGPAVPSGHFGGPYINSVIGDCVFMSDIDSNRVRRLQGGRIVSLCKDGEWREILRNMDPQGFNYKGWIIGPKGLNTVYASFCGDEGHGDHRSFIIRPVDLTKPAVGPKQGGQ